MTALETEKLMILCDQIHWYLNFCCNWIVWLHLVWILMKLTFFMSKILTPLDGLLYQLLFEENLIELGQFELIFEKQQVSSLGLMISKLPYFWLSWRYIGNSDSIPFEREKKDQLFMLMLAVSLYFKIWDSWSDALIIFKASFWFYRSQSASLPSHISST